MGELFFLSVKSWISCAFPTATFIQLQMIAVKPHGHRQNHHWLSMVRTIGNALALYHRNHKNKGFNGDGHSPGPVISRCVACVLAIHAQVMGVGRKGLMAASRPPCAWQHTGNPQLMNSPGWQGVRHTEEHFTKASLHPFQEMTKVWYAQNRPAS